MDDKLVRFFALLKFTSVFKRWLVRRVLVMEKFKMQMNEINSSRVDNLDLAVIN